MALLRLGPMTHMVFAIVLACGAPDGSLGIESLRRRKHGLSGCPGLKR